MSTGRILTEGARAWMSPGLTKAATDTVGGLVGIAVTAKTGSQALGIAASATTKQAIASSETATDFVGELAGGFVNITVAHVLMVGLIGYGIFKGVESVLDSIFD
jgi:hypothetical protein